MRASIVPNDERPSPRYIAWKCETIRKTDRRPGGLPHRAGCGTWQVKRTTSHNKHLQANCKHCGRRSRLNQATRRFYTYETKDAAETHCEALNRHVVDLTPEDIHDMPAEPAEAVELTEEQKQYIQDLVDLVNRTPKVDEEWF